MNTNTINKIYRPRLQTLTLATIAVLAGLVGCIEIDNKSSAAPESDNQAQVRLKNTQSQAEFKNHLIKPFTQLPAEPVYSISEDNFATTEEATSQPTADAAASDDTAFSGTNNQVTGVDEADIWKYDGTHFYVLKQAIWDYHYNDALTTQCYDTPDPVAAQSSSADIMPCYPEPTLQSPAQIRIVKNDQVTLATLDLTEITPNALYLNDDALVVLGNKTQYGNNWSSYQNWQDGQTDIRTLNVSDKTQPQETMRISIDGYVVQSRRIGDEIFVITRFSPNIDGIKAYPTNQLEINQNEALLESVSLEDLLPKISINGQQQALVSGEDCLLADVPEYQYNYPTIATITRIDITSGEFSSRCMAGQVDGIYMTETSLYLFNTSFWNFSQDSSQDESDIVWNWSSGNTHLHKFEIQSFDYQGSVILQGRLGWSNPRYRLGELSDGNLAVVTSEDSWRNPVHHLTVLGGNNGELSTLAQLPNEEHPAAIGKPGERIYSVRFMQDRAYIVTFMNTDPLYVLDLSNSSQPNIAGELEIPGFSDYLHPIGNELLLGVGQSANRAVKVSLFNVADIQNPSELGNKIIGSTGSNTLLSYQPHAFTGIQQEGQYRFAMPINVFSDNYNWQHSGLYLFDVTDNQLNQAGAMITHSSSDENSSQYGSDWSERRGLIQGDDVYHLKGSDIYHANWNTPEEISSKF